MLDATRAHAELRRRLAPENLVGPRRVKRIMAVTPTRSNRTPGARAQAAGPYVVLAVALALSSGLTYYSRATVAATDRSRFENAVQVARDRIHTRLSTYMGMLRAGSGLMAAHPDTTAAQFREYVGRLTIERNYPGIQGIGFTRRCPPEERAALVAAMREVYGSFTIWPESERAEYHAIVYLEPLDRRNRAAIGYDMFSESVRRAAMERARDTGEPAASGIVTLVQEIDEKKQAGFLIYVPVYRGCAAPPTVERRRAELVGYVYSPFRVDDLLAGIFGTEATPRVGFRIYDADHVDPARLLYSGFDHAPRASDGLVTEMALDVAGRKWTLLFVPAAGLEAGSGRALVSLVLVLSMLASAGLFAFSRSQALARAAAESAAEDLAHLLAQHRRSEDELRTLIEVIPIGIGIARDPKCDVITHNPHFYRILGVPP
jgi:CHASE1-domain containing sensor protein